MDGVILFEPWTFLGIYTNLLKFPKWISPSETILFRKNCTSKVMAKNTNEITNQKTAFEYKFHFDMRKWQKRQNGSQFTVLLATKQVYLAKNNWIVEENIEETA
jgi:hypothetical protein